MTGLLRFKSLRHIGTDKPFCRESHKDKQFKKNVFNLNFMFK